MDLPFLKARKMASTMIAKPGQQPEPAPEQDPMLMSIAEDLLSGIAMKDASAVADALEAAFSLLDSGDESENMDEGGMMHAGDHFNSRG